MRCMMRVVAVVVERRRLPDELPGWRERKEKERKRERGRLKFKAEYLSSHPNRLRNKKGGAARRRLLHGVACCVDLWWLPGSGDATTLAQHDLGLAALVARAVFGFIRVVAVDSRQQRRRVLSDACRHRVDGSIDQRQILGITHQWLDDTPQPNPKRTASQRNIPEQGTRRTRTARVTVV